MANKVLLVYLVLDFLFLCTGGLVLAFSLIFNPTKAGSGLTTKTDAASSLLLQTTPLSGGIVNAAFIFVAFLISLPGILMSKNRTWLRIQSWALVVCGLISLILGLDIWFSTLKTRSNLAGTWGLQPAHEQSLLQQQFKCCGYLDFTSPPFVTDNTCTDDQVAALLGGCAAPFSAFANKLLDIVFTAMFGMVALNALLFLAAIVVLKDRQEKERYRLIDAKYGSRGI
ncbi:MAG: phospholipid scramblase 1 [Stictis urceolatum]|nr:phospholipid scramblase 1 [Stictis urceolata]